jgi:hypothetical protein
MEVSSERSTSDSVLSTGRNELTIIVVFSYLAEADAKALNLTTISPSGTAIISIDRTSQLSLGTNRNSVRISSLDAYNPGTLIIVDLKHVPVGCGTWPALWSYNVPWPVRIYHFDLHSSGRD